MAFLPQPTPVEQRMKNASERNQFHIYHYVIIKRGGVGQFVLADCFFWQQ